MNCPNCNHEIADTAKFCDQCGTRRQAEDKLTSDERAAQRLDTAFVETWAGQRIRSAYIHDYASKETRETALRFLAKARELLCGPKDAEIARLKERAEKAEAEIQAASLALDGELTFDDCENPIVEACKAFAAVAKVLPEHVLDAEQTTLVDAVGKLIESEAEAQQAVASLEQQLGTAAANARREALEVALEVVREESATSDEHAEILNRLIDIRDASQPAAETQTPRYPTLENDVAWILAEYAQKHDSAEHEARLIAEHFRERQSEPIQPPARDVEGLADLLHREYLKARDATCWAQMARAVVEFIGKTGGLT